MAEALRLPIIDLTSPDCRSTAESIRQACVEYGFFYLVNHGVDEQLLPRVFHESKKFFSLPVEDKMKLTRKQYRGYTAMYTENLDPSSSYKGDSKESFYIGPLEGGSNLSSLNQWPSEEVLPSWRATMECYHDKVLCAGRRLLCLIALALNLDEDFFEKVGALNEPMAFLRLLHYPGKLEVSDEEIYGASAHSDYGMIALLSSDGVPGLQVCREKSKEPHVWEDVQSIPGSTLHRVMPTGRERYSAAFFVNPNADCMVECLESCCSELSPPRFPPIRSGDYLRERVRLAYGS